MPSGRSVTFAPSLVNSLTIATIRSLSLTRNSSASSMIVVPSAQLAAIANTGISSISRGITAPPIRQAFKAAERTRKSATGSPVTSRWFS